MTGNVDGSRCMSALMTELRDWASNAALQLPRLGHGQSSDRLASLASIARKDLPLARMIEAHVDALAILAEANRSPVPGATYGVWAANSPDNHLHLSRNSAGTLMLSGTKPFCTGGDGIDRALVTARSASTVALIDLSTAQPGLSFDASRWTSSAFAATRTADAFFAAVEVSDEQVVAEDNWYLDRPGFWNGACAPAACWAGGALGLIDAALASPGSASPHRHAAAGHLLSAGWQIEALLHFAGRSIDLAPDDKYRAYRNAACLRAAIADLVDSVVLEAAKLVGPRGLAFDSAFSDRTQELMLYVRQHHGAKDLADLGSAV